MKEFRIFKDIRANKILTFVVLFGIAAMLTMPTGMIIGKVDDVKEDIEGNEEDIGMVSGCIPEEKIGSAQDEDRLESLAIQPDEAASKDSFITNYTTYEGSNYGESDVLICGNDPGGVEYRSLIRFDLPPDVGEVESATLKLFSEGNNGQTNVTVRALYRHWDEGTGFGTPDMAVNWTHRTDSDTWGHPGGDFEDIPRSYRSCDMTDIWYSWDVTDIVDKWVSGTWDNNGLILSPAHFVSSSDWIRFYSSNSSDPSHFPKLVLSYSPIPEQELEINGPPKIVSLRDKEFGPVEHQTGPFETPYTNHPFDGSNANQAHYQSVFTPGQVGAEGVITRLSIIRTTLTTGNFSNFKIYMAHTDLDNLTATFADNYMGHLIEVFSSKNFEVNSSNSDPWVHFDLNGSFGYDSTHNLLVDIQWDGDGGTTIQSFVSSDIGVKRVLSTTGSGTGMTNSDRPVYRFTTEVLHGSVIDGGPSSNLYPFWSSQSYVKLQMLFTRSELGAKSGMIDHLSLYRDDAMMGAGTFPNLTFSLAHTTLSNLSKTFDNNYQGDLIEVHNLSSFTFADRIGWFDFNVDDKFTYNGQDNLLLEIEWSGSASGSSVFIGGGDTGSENRRLYTFSSNSTTGDADDWRYNTRVVFENTWEAQSMDPDLFNAEVDGTQLTLTPQPNARGIGELGLIMTNSFPRPFTTYVPVRVGMKDTMIRGDTGHTSENYGSYEFMYTGGFTNGSRIRSLLEFDLPDKTGRVIGASVSIFCFYIDQPGDVNVSLSPITNPWDENEFEGEDGAVNWYYRMAGMTWANPGGDFDTSYSSYRNVSRTAVWYDWNITEIVRAWYNGDIDNNGLMIRGNDYSASPYNYVGFTTSDQPNDHYWPKVTISFGPEEIPDQTMQENDPVRSIPLSGDEYNSITHRSGPSHNTNIWPFYGAGFDECHYQALYTPDQVGAEGRIDRISFHRASLDVGDFSSFNISMAHTSISNMTTTYADNYHGYLVEVYSVEKYETNSSNHDDWLTFDLNGNFTYDSSHNLLVDIKWSGDSGVNVPIYQTVGFSENRRVWGWNIGSSTGSGTDSYPPVMRFETEFTDDAVIDKGTLGNYWPFASGSEPEIRCQILYNHTLINASGTLDKIRFQAAQLSPDWSVVENLSIKMAHSQNDSLSSSFEAHNIDPWTETLNRSSYNFSTVGNPEWIEIDLDDPFIYNGNDNMLIDIQWRGGYGSDSGVDIARNTGSYHCRLAESPTWKGVDTTLYNIQMIFDDDTRWQADSLNPSLFTTWVSSDPALEIAPQPDQYGNGTLLLTMLDCNGYTIDEQYIDVEILETKYFHDLGTLTAGGAHDGWHFVSYNVTRVETDLTSILDDPTYGISGSYDRVMYYDAMSDDWRTYSPGRPSRFNDLHEWELSIGIWIHMTSDDDLVIGGHERPVSTAITLQPGWNMVAYPSGYSGNNGLPAEVTKVGYYDPSTTYNIAYDFNPGSFSFTPSQGYWIYNGADTAVDWYVDY